jgi:hypothetical protein
MGVYFMLYHYIVIALSIKQFSDDEKVVATDCLCAISLLWSPSIQIIDNESKTVWKDFLYIAVANTQNTLKWPVYAVPDV